MSTATLDHGQRELRAAIYRQTGGGPEYHRLCQTVGIPTGRQAQPKSDENRHGVQVGDIFYDLWGYDQTNIDYFLVVRVSKASAWIVPIGQKTTRVQGGGIDHVIPDPDSVRERCVILRGWDGETPVMKRTSRGYKGEPSITIESKYHYARPWDGNPDYQTATGWGH